MIFCRVLLSRLNPLLGDAVELRDTSRVAVWLEPSDRIWPSAAAEIRFEPLRIQVGQGALITRGLEVLKLVNAQIAAAARATTLQVDLSPLKAKFLADGSIEAKRLDISIGVPGLGRPLTLVSWGKAHSSPDGPISMTLAIPSETLDILGIEGLPEDFGVPINVTGTVRRPKIEIVRASKDVSLLAIKSKVNKFGGRSADWMFEELRLAGFGSDGNGNERFKMPVD